MTRTRRGAGPALARLGSAAALAALLFAAACESPSVPPRLLAYEYTLPGTSLVYRWPAPSVIRVHVLAADDPALEGVLEGAFELAATQWQNGVLYGEYHFERVPLERADVLLTWAPEELPIDVSGCQPVGATAVTTFCVEFDTAGEVVDTLPVFPLIDGEYDGRGVRMLVQVLRNQASVEGRVLELVAHEFGHVVGIGRHSPNASDLMAADPARVTLSDRDRATLELLYHTRADIRVVPGGD